MGIYWLFTVIISINQIIGGVRHGDFIEMNSGLLLILLNIGYLIFTANLGMLLNGFVLIALGGILLALNFSLAKSVKAIAEKEKGDEKDA